MLTRITLDLLHAVCGAYLLAAGLLYCYVLPGSTLANLLGLYSITLPSKYFGLVGLVHFAFAALHLGVLVSSVKSTVVAMVGSGRVIKPTHPIGNSPHQVMIQPVRLPAKHRMMETYTTRVRHLLHRAYSVLFARDGLLGVEGAHFDTVFLAREMLETVLQTYQAYQMSRLLPRPWMNRAYVVLLSLSCWSTPLLNLVIPHNLRLRRLLCLLVDIVLDFVSAIGVPVVLALEYIGDYNATVGNFPASLWFNDAWLVRFVSDTPVILLGSWVDAASRLLFSFSMVLSLVEVGRVLHASRDPRATPPPTKVSPTMGPPHSPNVAPSRLVRLGHLATAAVGIGVVLLHIHAVSKAAPPSCALELHPWLVDKPGCALVEINCHTSPDLLGPRGPDMDSITGKFDPISLSCLVIRHCPHVDLTPRIQTLHNLVEIKFYNSTISSWGLDAALTQVHHPQVRFLFLARVQFPNGALPPGLLAPNFPQVLAAIQIASSNLGGLPDNLHTVWPAHLNLFVEFSPLGQFPPVLTRMEVAVLSLIGCGITTIPREALLMPRTWALLLSLNPLSSLPDVSDNRAAAGMAWLFLDGTNVTALPAWMETEAFRAHTTVVFDGAPHCENVSSSHANGRIDLLSPRPSMNPVDRCGGRFPHTQGLYPLLQEVRATETW